MSDRPPGLAPQRVRLPRPSVPAAEDAISEVIRRTPDVLGDLLILHKSGPIPIDSLRQKLRQVSTPLAAVEWAIYRLEQDDRLVVESVLVSGPGAVGGFYPSSGVTKSYTRMNTVRPTDALWEWLPRDKAPAASPAGTDNPPPGSAAKVGAPPGGMEAKRIAAILEATAGKVFSVAKDERLSAEEKMAAIYRLDNQVLGWKSPRWSKLLGVTDAAVRKTEWWRTERPRLQGGG